MQDDKINEDDFEDLDFEDFDDEDFDDEDFDELDTPEDDATSPLDTSDDDLIAEDLGEDFPEDDDFGDEDWGDEDATGNTAGKPAKKGGSSKLSPKIILPLAVGVVALGGAGYYFMQAGSTGNIPTGQQQMPMDDMASIDAGLDITEDTLPMPAPMASPTEDEFTPDYASDVSDTNTIGNATVPGLNADGMYGEPVQDEPEMDSQAGTFADNDVLTPMPGLQETEEDSAIPLDSLGLDEAPDTNGAAAERPLSLAEIENGAINAMDSDDNAAQNSGLSAPPDIISDETSDQALDIGIPSEPESGMDFAMEEDSDNITDTSTVPDLANPAINVSGASEVDVTQYEEQISSLENNLSTKEATIAQMNAEIEALRTQLSAREQELESAQSSLEAIENQPRKEAAPAPAVQTPETVARKPSAPEPASKPAAAPVAKAEIKPKWELRAAQPGRAYIGIIGSGDVQVVETGDTLQGIGRVQSITLENGIWVVKGTNGSIKQ